MSNERSRLPQQPKPSNAVVRSVEWIYEPYWHGARLMAAVLDGQVTLTDEDGAPATGDAAEAAEVLRGALVDADGAVIDGVWTSQPFPGEGSSADDLAAIADEGVTESLPDPREAERRRAFVAVDLVELDGAPLHDVPCLERRRLLGSVVEENARVRISPAVRMPIDHWVEAWRANGFDSYVAKHVNSRYRPGEVVQDWLRLPTAIESPSTFDRLMGRRPKPVVHIEDGWAGGARPPRR